MDTSRPEIYPDRGIATYGIRRRGTVRDTPLLAYSLSQLTALLP